jgi:hypothetical protein
MGEWHICGMVPITTDELLQRWDVVINGGHGYGWPMMMLMVASVLISLRSR